MVFLFLGFSTLPVTPSYNWQQQQQKVDPLIPDWSKSFPSKHQPQSNSIDGARFGDWATQVEQASVTSPIEETNTKSKTDFDDVDFFSALREDVFDDTIISLNKRKPITFRGPNSCVSTGDIDGINDSLRFDERPGHTVILDKCGPRSAKHSQLTWTFKQPS